LFPTAPVSFVGFSLPFELTEPVRRVLWAAFCKGDLTMANGTVKWFNTTKGFGFIEPQGGGRDIFVHISAVERAGLTQINDGQAVIYEIETGRDGREAARDLKVA